MKTKFFLCIRPPVIETDDGDYIKLPPTVGSSYTTVSSKTSGRRKRDLRQGKRVAPEKFVRQLSVKSNGNNCFSGNISDGMPENPIQKDPQKAQKPTSPVSESNTSLSFSDEESVSSKKQGMISKSNSEVSGGPESNLGVYLMASSLIFTIFLGKFFGILCTLILVCSIYPHRKNDGNDGQIVNNMVENSPEKGSPEEYKKRVLMEGFLERKSYHRQNIKFSS